MTLDAPSLVSRSLTSAHAQASIAAVQARAEARLRKAIPSAQDRLPVSARGRRVRARRPHSRRRAPHVDPGDRQGLAERRLPRALGDADEGDPGEPAQPGAAGHRGRQALGRRLRNGGRGHEDRGHRRWHRRPARLLRPLDVLLPVRVPEGADVEDDAEGDRATRVRAELARVLAREIALRPVAKRVVPRDARRRHRCGRPQHPGRRPLPFGCRARRFSRELQGADDPDARVRARRELGRRSQRRSRQRWRTG